MTEAQANQQGLGRGNPICSALLGVTLLALTASCRKSEAPSSTHAAQGVPVVVYCSVDDVYARSIARTFTQKYGVVVQLVTDSEETKSTGLLNRLIAEKNRPRADVFWSGDPIRNLVLKSRGISSPYASPSAVGLPPQFSDPDSHFSGFSARCRLILFNSTLMQATDAPSSIAQFTDLRFRGRGCIANPLFGTTAIHAAALFQAWGDNQAKAFFEGLVSNGIKMVSSNGEVRRRVSAGEFSFGLCDSDDVNVALGEGKPVGFIVPDQDKLGCLLVPNAVSLIAGGPNPTGGKQFIDYLLSPEVEKALAESTAAQLPLRPGLAPPRPFAAKPLADMKLMPVDYPKTAHWLEELGSGYLADWAARQN